MKHLNSWIIVTLLILTAACSKAPPPKEAERIPAQNQLQKAEALFKERCKTAGEFIHRTADNVEGIYLLKPRPTGINYGNQFEMDDPYGNDVGGDGYFHIFLLGKTKEGSLSSNNFVTKGYRYIEATDPADGKRYRYTGRIEEPWQHDKKFLKGYTRFVLDKTPANGAAPQYGVTYDDISTREERELWIAGSSLKVIDLKTNEVMAERIGYMMDRGQGNNSGGRSPWLMAERNACPSFPVTPGGKPFKMYQTRNFVERVLVIKQEK